MGKIESRPQLAGPLYVQVADLLRNRIEELEWRPDLAMPNETQLAREMGVSIGTMRKALEALEDQKYITRRQGRGTFVMDTSFEAELARFECIFRADLTKGGEVYGSRCCRRVATSEEQAALEIGDETQVIAIARSRRQTNAYTASERIVVPAALLDGLDQIEALTDPLLFATYRRDFHVVVTSVGETILPCNADEDLARQLGIAPGTAVLRISRKARTGNGQPVEWSVRHVHIVQPQRGASPSKPDWSHSRPLDRLAVADSAS